MERAFVVYQAGIANVFKVSCFNLSNYGREAVRVYQGDFRGAEMLARGLASAGVVVRSAACNMAGDIKDLLWTDDLEGAPFSDKFNVVREN